MQSKFGSGVLCALLASQALFGFVAVAAVAMKTPPAIEMRGDTAGVAPGLAG